MPVPLPDVSPEPYAVLVSHAFDLDQAAYLLRTGVLRTVVLLGWGMRLAHYRSPQTYRALFQSEVRGHALPIM